MPTDDPTPDPPKPPDPPGPPPGPTEDQVRGFVRDELAKILAGPKDPDIPLPRTDKELEDWMEKAVQKAMLALKESGDPTPDPKPDPTPKPEDVPEVKTKWQDKVRTFLWGE